MIQNKFSYSSLSLYEACPMCWWLRYVARVKTTKISSALIIGKIIHEYLENEGEDSLGIESIVKKHMPTPDLIKGSNPAAIKEECIKMARVIDENPINIEPAEREVEFFVPLGSGVLHGFIDFISKNDEIVEHKTSKIKYDIPFIKKSHQYRLYALAFQHLKGRLPSKIIYDVIYKSKNPIRDLITVDITDHDIEISRNWAVDIINKINNKQFIPVNGVDRLHRSWCDYPICQYCCKR